MYLFVGLSTVDIHYHVDRLPADNEKIKVASPEVLMGGPAANAAIACAVLGGKSKIITAIGEHALGGLVKDEFKHFDIEVVDIWKGVDIQPTLASVFSNKQSGERAIISHFPPKLKVNVELLNKLDLGNIKYVLIDGFHPEITIPLCRRAKANGVKIVFDGGSWKSYLDNVLPFVDIAICSNDFYPPGCQSTSEVMHYLKAHNIYQIAITRGAENILYCNDQKEGEIIVPGINAIDTSGAGDIFHGAFLFYLKDNVSFYNTLLKASKVASYKCGFKGTRTWIDSHPF